MAKQFIEDTPDWQKKIAERKAQVRKHLNLTDAVSVLDLSGVGLGMPRDGRYITGTIIQAPEDKDSYTIRDDKGKEHTFLYANLQNILLRVKQ